MATEILKGDSRVVLGDMNAKSIHMSVTSPPY